MSTRTGWGIVELKDDFLLSADHSGWNDNTENSGTAAILANTEDGFIELTTGTTIGNRSQITGERVWRSESGGPLQIEIGARLVTDLLNKSIFLGFTDVTTIENPVEGSGTADELTTTATDAVGFMYDEADTTTDRWFAVGVDSNVDAAGSGPLDATWSQTTPVAATDYSFRIVVSSAASSAAEFYINGIQVFRDGAAGWTDRRLTGAVSANVNLCPTALIECRAAAAESIYIDGIWAVKGRNV